MIKSNNLFLILLCCLLLACETKKSAINTAVTDSVSTAPEDSLPAPYATKSVKNFSHVLGWAATATPKAPAGFIVTKYADKLQNPRWIYVAPNGDVLVAESSTDVKGFKKIKDKISGKIKSENEGASANRITLLRDGDGDGKPELRQALLTSLNQPFGMLALGNVLYVGNTDGIFQFPYQPGQTQIKSEGKKILELPAGGYNNHWTRNIISNRQKTKLYISVGSGSNHGEHGVDNEIRRANILETNLDGSGEQIYASGLRNPVGMGWAPGTDDLWTTVNERDDLGDELVPDYLTFVKRGGFYGWPYAYWGHHEDPRVKEKQPTLVAKAIVPDISLGAHTASLGLAFYDKNAFPEKYRGGVFIGQHGSWNKSQLAGYKVIFVPFKDGKPTGEPEDFLTGFVANLESNEVYGRPVGIAILPDGSMLVADDAGNTIWQVKAIK